MGQGPRRPPAGLIYVIAGNVTQFRYWCQFIAEVSPRSPAVRYVSEPYRLMGLRIRASAGDRVAFYGTYYERKDWYEIAQQLALVWED